MVAGRDGFSGSGGSRGTGFFKLLLNPGIWGRFCSACRRKLAAAGLDEKAGRIQHRRESVAALAGLLESSGAVA